MGTPPLYGITDSIGRNHQNLSNDEKLLCSRRILPSGWAALPTVITPPGGVLTARDHPMMASPDAV